MDATQNLEEFNKLLIGMEKFGASDLHLKVGSAPIYRVQTFPQRLKTEPLTNEFVFSIGTAIMNPLQRSIYERDGAVDFSHSVPGSGRFRINFYKQRGSHSLVARRIPFDIPALEDLMLPASLGKLCDFRDGLVLIVGMTGSGKSTTLASIINQINLKHRAHILTIEDPIEFLYSDQRSFINQREIGSDAPDFHTALRAALRQDPDVVLVGEIRDMETMETVMAAAETGHLVLGTLHATNVVQAILRTLEFFPVERHDSIRQVLGASLRGIVAQKLLPGRQENKKLVPAVEVLLTHPVIRKYVAEGEYGKIRDSLRTLVGEGMQDFNMSLLDLVKRDLITKPVALSYSPNPEQLEMHLKGMS